MKTSKWSYHINQKVIVILDEGSDLDKSVTNDAERVLETVRDLMGADAFDTAPAVIYRDSEGEYDGLQYDVKEDIAEFYPLRAKSEEMGVKMALSKSVGTIVHGSED